MLNEYFIGEGDTSGDLKPIGEKMWLFETCQCSRMFLLGSFYGYLSG